MALASWPSATALAKTSQGAATTTANTPERRRTSKRAKAASMAARKRVRKMDIRTLRRTHTHTHTLTGGGITQAPAKLTLPPQDADTRRLCRGPTSETTHWQSTHTHTIRQSQHRSHASASPRKNRGIDRPRKRIYATDRKRARGASRNLCRPGVCRAPYGGVWKDDMCMATQSQAVTRSIPCLTRRQGCALAQWRATSVIREAVIILHAGCTTTTHPSCCGFRRMSRFAQTSRAQQNQRMHRSIRTDRVPLPGRLRASRGSCCTGAQVSRCSSATTC